MPVDSDSVMGEGRRVETRPPGTPKNSAPDASIGTHARWVHASGVNAVLAVCDGVLEGNRGSGHLGMVEWMYYWHMAGMVRALKELGGAAHTH